MPTIKPFALAVKALVADERGRILAIRRSAESNQFGGNWDLPGGKVDPGESFDAALLREAAEETGLDIALTGVAGAIEYECPTVRLAVLFMEAEARSGQVRLSGEHDDYAWVERSELPEAGFAGQLREFVLDYCRRR
ncbi:MAG: NUDIX domain-containing protein [Pirellulales bacterium]|nr:NUDIX domain-containing protein [Pirellulales bacterium]